jgi:hypothetical protein
MLGEMKTILPAAILFVIFALCILTAFEVVVWP